MAKKAKREKSWLKAHVAQTGPQLTEQEQVLLDRIRKRHTGLLHFKTAEAQHPEETKSLLAKGLIERRGLFYILPPQPRIKPAATSAVAPAQAEPASQEDDVAAVMGGRLRSMEGKAGEQAKPRPSFPPMPLSNALQIDQSTPEGQEQWRRLERGICPNNHEGDELQLDGYRHGVLNLMCSCGFKTSAGINTPTGEAVLAQQIGDVVAGIRLDYDNFIANRHRCGRKPR